MFVSCAIGFKPGKHAVYSILCIVSNSSICPLSRHVWGLTSSCIKKKVISNDCNKRYDVSILPTFAWTIKIFNFLQVRRPRILLQRITPSYVYCDISCINTRLFSEPFFLSKTINRVIFRFNRDSLVKRLGSNHVEDNLDIQPNFFKLQCVLILYTSLVFCIEITFMKSILHCLAWYSAWRQHCISKQCCRCSQITLCFSFAMLLTSDIRH